jgi:hypothetical protein
VKAAAVLVLVAACGDNVDRSVHLDSAFDDHHTRFFGVINGLGPAPARTIAPVDGASLCVGDACAVSTSTGTFVLEGPGPEQEGTIVAGATGYLTTVLPVVGGAAGDRNLAQVLLVSPQLDDQAAGGFHIDPMLDTDGIVLLIPDRHDHGMIQVDIAGITTSYLDDMALPDPTRTTMSQGGGAVFYQVAPGEAVIRTTSGRCEPEATGWPGAAPGEIRVPVVAGQVTLVQPVCIGI